MICIKQSRSRSLKVWARAIRNQLILASLTLVVLAGPNPRRVAAAGTPGSGAASPLFTADHEVNVRAVGARLDGRSVFDVGVRKGSPVITSAAAHFSADDAGKLIIVCARTANPHASNAWRNTYTGRIASVQSASQASLAGQYQGESQSGAFAFFASDDTAALQAAIDATGELTGLRTGVVRLPGKPAMISRTLLIERKSIEFAGQGMFATIAGNNPGTALVWAGPRGAAMIKVEGCLGVRLHDLNLLGNSNPANQPSAMIELANSHHINSFNRVYNIYGGAINMTDQGVQAAAGISLVSSNNNDRNMFDNVRLDHVAVGYKSENQMAVVEHLANFTCFNCSTEISLAHGGDVDIVNLEALEIGTIFVLGHGARVTVDSLDSENSGGLQKGRSQLVRFATFGGSLTIRHGNFSLSCSLPADGVIVDTTDNYPAALMLYDFALTHNQGCVSVVTPVIRFKVNGAAPGAMTQRYFVCEGCRSLNFAKLDLNPTGHDQLAVSMVSIRTIPQGAGYTGTDTFNLLQGPGDAYDAFRRDVPGKLSVMGGPLTVRALVPPQYIYMARCNAPGAKSYYYRVTARSAGTETTGSPERGARCASGLSESSHVWLQWFPVAGADSYGVYRGDAPGRERLIAIVPANSVPAGLREASPMGYASPAGYKDIGGGPIGAGVPLVNTTGAVSVAGSVQLGSALAAGLGSPPDGTELYCRDCRSAAGERGLCAPGGTGQLAVRIAHVWKCF